MNLSNCLLKRKLIAIFIHYTDQFVISELRNQIQSLKNQHRDHIEQIKHERQYFSSLLLILDWLVNFFVLILSKQLGVFPQSILFLFCVISWWQISKGNGRCPCRKGDAVSESGICLTTVDQLFIQISASMNSAHRNMCAMCMCASLFMFLSSFSASLTVSQICQEVRKNL